MTLREELQHLVSTLPEGALPQARTTLRCLQTWSPPPPPVPAAPDDARAWVRDVHERHSARMQARLQEIQERHPERPFISMGGGGGRVGSDGRRFSRHSLGYPDGDDHVHETAIVHANQQLVLIERIRTDDAAGQLLLVLEVTGPDGRTVRQECGFNVTSE